jgi:hypothetical protein
MQQLSIEKILLAGLGLAGPEFKRIDGLLIGYFIVRAGGTRGDYGHGENNEECRSHEPHEEPPLAVLPWP